MSIDEELAALRLAVSIHFLSISILYYDHLVTFRDELRHIWTRPLFGARAAQGAWWFIVNRYFNALINIPVTVLIFVDLEGQSCKSWKYVRQFVIIVTQVVTCGILITRTYALYNRSKRVLYGLLVYTAILLAVAVWALLAKHDTQFIAMHLKGCHTQATKGSAIWLAVSWECLLAFDMAIFGLTLARTWRNIGPQRRQQAWRSWGGANDRPADIASIVWRDGAVYFAIMGLANVANTLTFYLAGPLNKGVLATLATSLSVTLCSRLMLNLHDSAEARSVQHSGAVSTTAADSGAADAGAGDWGGGGAFTSQFELGKVASYHDDEGPVTSWTGIEHELNERSVAR